MIRSNLVFSFGSKALLNSKTKREDDPNNMDKRSIKLSDEIVRNRVNITNMKVEEQITKLFFTKELILFNVIPP